MAKKVGAIVSLSIIAILIITTIILANLKVDYSVECNKPDSIWVNGSVANETEMNEIVNYINDASKTTRLSALFNGEWNKEVSLMTENGTIYYNDDNYYVRYHYTTQQELKVNNETKNATYAELVFTVSKIDEKAEYKVYVIPDATKSSTYSHYYTIEEDFGTLYKYLENNFAK